MVITRAVLAGAAVLLLAAGFVLWQDSQVKCIASTVSGGTVDQPMPSGGPWTYRACE
jgi:hypothetical protein